MLEPQQDENYTIIIEIILPRYCSLLFIIWVKYRYWSIKQKIAASKKKTVFL